MNVRLKRLCLAVVVLSGLSGRVSAVSAAEARPNFLIVTVDDMNCDSVGAFGCRLPGTTPSIDRLAESGMRFRYAHVQTGSCFPSRNVMFSGRYSHNTGVEGFYQVKEASYPHLVDAMQGAGYFVAIRGKVSHSTPYQPYHWDADLTVIDGEKQHTKNARSYYLSTSRGIDLAAKAKKPFCLNINISDPHKPFYAMGKGGEVVADDNVPSRIYKADEVPIPGFLFDHPEVRKELAHYYSSVRRADDCFEQIMRALDESDQQKNTVIIFLSDHGMPLPFAKTAVWYHSTRTPLIVRWPGVTRADSVDEEHMVSAVDLMPTILDIAGIEHPDGFDGRSFAAVLQGKSQAHRDFVYTFHNENSGRNRSPMRSVQSRRYGYIFNPWSDGKRIFKTATTGTMTFRTMQKLAPTNETIAARLDLFQHRVPEEFYDYASDPDARHNLINDPRHAAALKEHRAAMHRIMVESRDPLLDVFDRREDAEFASRRIDQLQAEADARRKAQAAKQPRPRRKQNQRLFQLKLPTSANRGRAFEVTIEHQLPAGLGEQSFHVTLKDAGGKRLQRIVKTASGKGHLKVAFMLPADLATATLSVSTFVGKDYSSNLLHRTAGPVRVDQ